MDEGTSIPDPSVYPHMDIASARREMKRLAAEQLTLGFAD